MAVFDSRQWAIIGYKDETGLGRMTGDLRSLLNPVRFFAMPSVRIQGNPLSEGEVLLDPRSGEQELEHLLEGLQGVIFFEHQPHPSLLHVAARMKIPTVCVPMWEWFNPYLEEWKWCTRFFCPNRFCQKMLNRLGFDNTSVITWPINWERLPERAIQGPARVFVHNAGIYEPDDRKGTRNAIEAFQRVDRSDLRLIVRCQNELPFRITDPRVEVRQGNLPDHAALYAEGDVVIQASKAEGLGFGILEAMASGMPVITTNYPPMNESIRHRGLLAGTHWGRKPAQQSTHIPQAHFKVPRVASLARSILWCARHDMGPVSALNRKTALETFDRTLLRKSWSERLEALLK